jgi:hypothetical protein
MQTALKIGMAALLFAGLAGAEPGLAGKEGAGGACAPEALSRTRFVPCSEAAGVQDTQLMQLESPDDRARLLYCRGVQRLGTDDTDALACFERSSQLRPHALTMSNIAVLELQMERYTQARAAAGQALARHAQTGELCGAALSRCAELEKLQRLIQLATARQVHLRVQLEPADARLAVDGRPLVRVGGGPVPRFGVGLGAAAPPPIAPGARFDLELDPGFHAFSVDSKGFARQTIHRSFHAGEQSELELILSSLPAVLSIRADRPDAIVQINQVDVGPTPVDVKRPPGDYKVVVLKSGFEPYETRVHVAGGEALSMSARLVEEPPPVTKTWWFWTSIGAFLASSALIYYVAQPTPAPPPYDGGSTRWVVTP